MELLNGFQNRETPSLPPDLPKEAPKPLGPALVEIARMITNGDEAVLREAAACAQDPKGWFAAHQERYEERGVDSPDDLDSVQWLGLVDLLEEHGWVCERDWQDELEDFLYFLENLKGFRALGLELDESWFDEEDDIPAWCTILTEKWEGVCVAAIDIDSDSYVLFPIAAPQLAQLQKLAEEIGHRIDAAERM